jgi:hypothetical protein
VPVGRALEPGRRVELGRQRPAHFPFRIGAIGATGGGKFNGTIDEGATYNAALSATQVQQHYDAR